MTIDSKIKEILMRMMPKVRRTFSRSINVDQFFTDAQYAEGLICDCLDASDLNLAELARTLSQLYAEYIMQPAQQMSSRSASSPSPAPSISSPPDSAIDPADDATPSATSSDDDGELSLEELKKKYIKSLR